MSRSRSSAGFNGCTLFVGGLSPYTRASDVGHEFERYGPLKRCDIPMSNGRSRGHGFVEFKYPEDAETAYRSMGRFELGGRLITVEWAKSGPGRGWNQMVDRPRDEPRRDDRREDYRREEYRRDDRRDDYRREDLRRDDYRRDDLRRDDRREVKREDDRPRDDRREIKREDDRRDDLRRGEDRKRPAESAAAEPDRDSKRQRTDEHEAPRSPESEEVEEVHEYPDENIHQEQDRSPRDNDY